MKGLLHLSKLIDGLSVKVGKFAIWAVLLSVMVCSLNALLRKMFETSAFYKDYSNAMSETQLFLFGVIFLLGSAYTLRLDEHVRIDVVAGRWSERGQMLMDLIGFTLFLLPVCILVFYFSLSFVANSYNSHETSGNSFLPLWPFKTLISIGFLLLILQGISEIIKRVAYFKGLIPFSELRREHKSADDEVKAYIEEVGASIKH